MKYFKATEAVSPREAGGKAFNLYRLKKAGFRVPDWVVIPRQALQDQLPESKHPETLQHAIQNITIDETWVTALLEEFTNPEGWFAVRSSAVDEDGTNHSFAGIFESHLYVDKAHLAEAIKKVWASACSERVIRYRKTHQLEQQFGIAVIIQEMVNPQVAGVAFGSDPVNGNDKTKLICSVYGLGESLVSGATNADTFTLKEGKIKRQLAKKEQALMHAPKGGTQWADVPAEKQHEASINDAMLDEIAKVLDRLQSQLGHPQDIEFAIAQEQLYVLQTRPVTTHTGEVKKPGEYVLWDNSNIIESYPGVTTPLTFSYILSVYERVYMQLAGIMGASESMIQARKDTFENMLGLIHGRVYYNLLSWYKVLAMFPGYSLNAEFMENMMGVKERFELPKHQQMAKGTAYWRTFTMVLKIIRSFLTLKRETRRFIKEVDEVISDYKAINFEEQDAHQLMALYKAFDHTLLLKWKAPLINDSFAMFYFGKLQKMIARYNISKNPNLQNDLLCGSKDIISTEPIHRSIELASVIQKSEEWKTVFETKSPGEIRKTLQAMQPDDKHIAIREKIEAYIAKFGDRCVGELKLETVSYTQDPERFIKVLKEYVVQGVTHATINSGIEEKLRKDAEAEVNRALSGFRKRKFKKVLAKTRHLVSNRENLRYERTRVFGMVRTLFLQMGKRLEEQGSIAHSRDIFYLTKEEIFDYIKGTSVQENLRELINLRKAEFAAYEKTDPPSERIPTYGVVYAGNDFYNTSKVEPTTGDLKGMGCCPGQVTARVQVVRHPDEVSSLNGDILITTSTDPGWVTLFPTASAIIVERGSLLSHSAIVSREMGIPCIVSVNGLLQQLQTGDLVEMDGSTGWIKIIEKHGR